MLRPSITRMKHTLRSLGEEGLCKKALQATQGRSPGLVVHDMIVGQVALKFASQALNFDFRL